MTNIFVDDLLLTSTETKLLAIDQRSIYNQSVIRLALISVMKAMGLIADEYTYTPLNGSNAGILVLSSGKTYRISAKDTEESTIPGKRLILTGNSGLPEKPKQHFNNCQACSTHPAEDYLEDNLH